MKKGEKKPWKEEGRNLQGKRGSQGKNFSTSQEKLKETRILI